MHQLSSFGTNTIAVKSITHKTQDPTVANTPREVSRVRPEPQNEAPEPVAGLIVCATLTSTA